MLHSWPVGTIQNPFIWYYGKCHDLFATLVVKLEDTNDVLSPSLCLVKVNE